MESDIGIDFIVSLMCFLVTALLFGLYFKDRINKLELILYSYSAQTFYLSFLSKTISPFFFVCIYFAVIQFVKIIQGLLKINIIFFIVLLLPFLSSIVIFFLVGFGINVFETSTLSFLAIISNAFIFYFKYFLPLIFLGSVIYEYSEQYSSFDFFNVFKRVALVSCYLALIQLLLTKIIDNIYVLRFLGVRSEFLAYTASGYESDTARISALFLEPKALSYFLAIAFPLFLQERKLYPIILILLVGILTASQTFFVGIVISILIFIVFKRVRNIRVNIIFVLLFIVSLFFLVSSAKQSVYNFYSNNSSNSVVRLIMARAMDRYDVDDTKENNLILGMPLQRDMELPVFNFFNQHRYLYFSGYGLKNGGYIPFKYFPSGIEKFRSIGTISYAINMRWFYFICEFGIVIFLVYFFYFTRQFESDSVTVFEQKYYAFLWCFLFFIDIEQIVIIVYAYYIGKKNKQVKF